MPRINIGPPLFDFIRYYTAVLLVTFYRTSVEYLLCTYMLVKVVMYVALVSGELVCSTTSATTQKQILKSGTY